MKRGDRYELISSFNEAGLGKYWTVAAPGSRIYSSAVVDGSYVELIPEQIRTAIR